MSKTGVIEDRDYCSVSYSHHDAARATNIDIIENLTRWMRLSKKHPHRARHFMIYNCTTVVSPD